MSLDAFAVRCSEVMGPVTYSPNSSYDESENINAVSIPSDHRILTLHFTTETLKFCIFSLTIPQ